MAKAKATTYYVLYLDFREECVKATSVKTTAKTISFFNDETLALIVSVSEIRRIGQTKYETVKEFEKQAEENGKLEALRTQIARLKTN